VVHRGRSSNRPSTFCASISVGTTPQRLRLQARRSTSYTVCLDRFNSLAVIATIFFSRFICKIIVSTVAVTLLGMPLGLRGQHDDAPSSFLAVNLVIVARNPRLAGA
jgi:hypothetical protein